MARSSCAARRCGPPRLTTRMGLRPALESLIEPATRGDPKSPLRWTCKSTRRAGGGVERGRASRRATDDGADAAARPGYSLQANRKTGRGTATRTATPSSSSSPGGKAFQRRGEPVISVDTKKKELVGDFKNGGREWRPQGRTARGAGPRLPDRPWARRSPTASTTWLQRGLGQRGHRSRHRGVRGRGDRAAGGEMGRKPSTRRHSAADHGRRRRQQRARGRLCGR